MPLQTQSGASPTSSNKRITKEACNCHITLSFALRRGRVTSQSYVSLSASRTEGTVVSLGAAGWRRITHYKSREGFGVKLQSAGEWFGKGYEGHSFVMAILSAGPSGFCCGRWFLTQKVLLKPSEILPLCE